jgi:hypothetical protein
MKLIDKIQQTNSGKPTDYSKIYTPTAELIEKITDEFAVEFAEWIERKNYWYAKDVNCYYKYGGKQSKYTTKELLELFKKEKGL